MKDFYRRLIQEVSKKTKLWRGTVMTLAAIVVFTTTYALILPALSMDVVVARQDAGIGLENENTADFSSDAQAGAGTGAASAEKNTDTGEAQAPAAADTDSAAAGTEPDTDNDFSTDEPAVVEQQVTADKAASTLTAEIPGATVTLAFGAEAGVPEGTILTVTALTQEEAGAYRNAAQEKADASVSGSTVTTAQFYRLALTHDGETVTPDGDADIHVDYTQNLYLEQDETAYAAVYTGEASSYHTLLLSRNSDGTATVAANNGAITATDLKAYSISRYGDVFGIVSVKAPATENGDETDDIDTEIVNDNLSAEEAQEIAAAAEEGNAAEDEAAAEEQNAIEDEAAAEEQNAIEDEAAAEEKNSVEGEDAAEEEVAAAADETDAQDEDPQNTEKESEDFDAPESLTEEDTQTGLTELNLGDVVIRPVDEELLLPADTEGHAEVLEGTEADEAQTAVEEYVNAQNALKASQMKKAARRQTLAAATSTADQSEQAYQVFDIALENVDAEAYKGGFKVEVSLSENIIGKDFHLYHIHEGETEEIAVDLDERVLDEESGVSVVSGFTFETANFSEFVLVYTVDFEFNGYTFSYPGKVPFMLSDLLYALHIDVDAADVADIRFSNGDLFRTTRVDDDWELESIESFTSLETVVLELADGSEYVIYLTDPEADATINLNEVDASGKSVDVKSFVASVSKAVEKTEQNRDSSFSLNFAFELTDEGFAKLQAGAAGGFPTIVYDLNSYINDPDVPIELVNNMSTPLMDGDKKIGQVRVENGVAIMTITDLTWLAAQTRFDADFDLKVTTSSSKLGTRDYYEFDFPGTTGDFTITYKKITFTSTKSVDFNGRYDGDNVVLTYDKDGNYLLNYTVRLNNPTELDKMVFSDTMTGSQYLYGDVTVSGAGKTATVTNQSGQSINFDVLNVLGLESAPAGDYVVTYTAKIDKDKLKTIGEEGITEEKNEATWTVTGDKPISPDPVILKPEKDYPPMTLEKKVNNQTGTGITGWTYGSELNYEIEFGNSEKPMAGITIYDQMTDNQKLIGDILLTYADGTTETITPSEWSGVKDNNYSNNRVTLFEHTLKSNAGNGPVKVTYKTQVISKEEAIAAGIYGTQSVSNNANSQSVSSETEGKVTFPEKPEQKKEVSAAQGTTDGKWKLGDTLTYTLTYGSKDIPLDGHTVSDVMTKLQNLNAGSIQIQIAGKDTYAMPGDAIKWINLSNAADYSTDTAQVFEYTFPDGSGNGPVTITYTTTLINADQVKQLNISGDQNVNNTFTVDNNSVYAGGRIPTNEPNKVSKSVKNLTHPSSTNWMPGDKVEYTIVLEGDRLNGSVVTDYATDIQKLDSDIVIKDKNGTTVMTISKTGDAIGSDFKDTNYALESKKLFEATIPAGEWVQPLTATYTMEILDAKTANQDYHWYGLQGTNNSVTTDRGGNGTTGKNTDFGEKPVIPKSKEVTGSPNAKDVQNSKEGWQPEEVLNYTIKFGDSNTKMAGYTITDRMTNLQHLIVPEGNSGIIVAYTDILGDPKTIYMDQSAITTYSDDDWSTNLVQLFNYTMPDDAGYGEVTVTYSTKVISLAKATEKGIYDLQKVENRFTFDGETVTTWGDVPFKDDPKPKKYVDPIDDNESILEGNTGDIKGWQPDQELTYTAVFGDETLALNGANIWDQMTNVQTLVGDVVVSWSVDGVEKFFVMPVSSSADARGGVTWKYTHTEGQYTYNSDYPESDMRKVFDYTLPAADVDMPGKSDGTKVGEIKGPVTVTYRVKTMTQDEAAANGLYGLITVKNVFYKDNQPAMTAGDIPYEDKQEHHPQIRKTGFVNDNGEPVWPTAEGAAQPSHQVGNYLVYDAPEGAHTNIDLSTGGVTWIMEVSAKAGSVYPLTDVYVTENLQQTNANVGNVHKRLDQLMAAGKIDAVEAVIRTASGEVLTPGADYSIFFCGDNPQDVAPEYRETVYTGQKSLVYYFPTIKETTYISLTIHFNDPVVGSYVMGNNVDVRTTNQDIDSSTVSIGGYNSEIIVSKEGKADATDSRIIEWTVDINKEAYPIDPDWEQILFTDILPDGLEVVNYNDPTDHNNPNIRVQTWGGAYTNENYLWFPVQVKDGEIQPVDIHYVKYNNDRVEDGINAEVYLSGTRYQVKYKTWINDETWEALTSSASGSKTFSNTALFSDGDKQTFSGSTDVTVKEDDFINKQDVSRGTETDGVVELEGNLLSYLIDVNPNGYNMNNGEPLKLSDTIPTSMNLNAPSIKVYKVTPESIQALKEAGHSKLDRTNMYDTYGDPIERYMGEDITKTLKISYNDDTRVLSIEDIPDSQYYRVFFQASMRSTGGTEVETFSNTVTLFGAGSYSDSEETQHKSSEIDAHAHGGMSMRKLDENNIKKGLEGAVFELYRVYTTPVTLTEVEQGGKVTSYTVNDNGAEKVYRVEQITVGADENGQYTSDKNGDVKFGTFEFSPNTLYYWIERQAPEGYIAELDVPHYFVLYDKAAEDVLSSDEKTVVRTKAQQTQLNMLQAWALDGYWEKSYGIRVASYPNDSLWYATNSQYRSITATKKWEGDSNNLYKMRPEDGVKLTLIRINADGSRTSLDTRVVKGDNSNIWPSYTWNYLEVYDEEGNEYKYTVEEEPVTDYYAEYSDGGKGITSGEVTIVNRPTPGKTSIEVEKVWKVSGNLPGSIQVQLVQIYTDKDNNTYELKDSEFEQKPVGLETIVTLIPDQNGKWSYTWNNLPSKDGKGGKYTYTVREISALGANVTVDYSDEGTGIVKGKITITNIEPGALIIKKKVTVNGQPTTGTEADGVYTFNIIDAEGTIVKSVPLTIENGVAGELLVDGLAAGDYIVREVMPANGTAIASGTPKEYNLTVVAGLTAGTEVPVAEFTNNKDTTRLTVKKNWFTDSTDWPQDAVATIRLMEVTENGEKIALTGVEADREDAVVVLNNEQQTYTWTGLNADKKYTVVEDALAGFTAEVSEIDAKQTITVTNKEVTSLSFHKEWQGEAPENWMAEIALVQRERVIVEYGEHVKAVPDFEGAYTDAGYGHVFVVNNDSYTFANLPKYRHDGNTVYEIEYSVEEVGVTINGVDKTDEYTGVVTGTDIIKTVTNTPSVCLPVEKIWDGGAPRDIESVTLALYNVDGTEVAKRVDGSDVEEVALPIVDGEGNKVWTYTFRDLPRDTEFTLKETKVTYTNKKTETDEAKIARIFGAIVNDEATVDGKPGKSVTNRRDAIDIPVVKVWSDKVVTKNRVEVTLYSVTTDSNGAEKEKKVTQNANGETISSVLRLNGNNNGVNWHGVWTNLPKYDSNGEAIQYRIRETYVNADGVSYSSATAVEANWGENTKADVLSTETIDGEIEIKNEPVTADLTVSKRWSSSYTVPADAKVYLALMRNGQPATADGKVAGKDDTAFVFELPKGSKWTDSLSGLPKYDNTGVQIKWSVKETKITYGDVVLVDKDPKEGEQLISSVFTVSGEGEFTYVQGSNSAVTAISNNLPELPKGETMDISLNKIWGDGTSVPANASATFTLHQQKQDLPAAENRIVAKIYASNKRTLLNTMILDKTKTSVKLNFEVVKGWDSAALYYLKDNQCIGGGQADADGVYTADVTLSFDAEKLNEDVVLELYVDKKVSDFTKAPNLYDGSKAWQNGDYSWTITLSNDPEVSYANNGDWGYIWQNLPKVDVDKGYSYRYWLTEDSSTPDDFIAKFSTGNTADTALTDSGEITVTNRQGLKVTKVWSNGKQTIEPPTDELKTVYFKLYAEYWQNNQWHDDGYLQDSDLKYKGQNITYKGRNNNRPYFELTYNGGAWSSIIFQDLPTNYKYYVVECDASGKDLSGEQSIDADTSYTIAVTMDGESVDRDHPFSTENDATVTITNTIVNPDEIPITVSKAWVNADGTTTWPEGLAVKVSLYRVDGATETLVGKPEDVETANWANPTTLNSSAATYTWQKVPAKDENGDPIDYIVREISVTKGGTEYPVNEGTVAVDGITYSSFPGEVINKRATVTNAEQTQINVTKTWSPEGDTVTFEKPADAVMADESKLSGGDVTVNKSDLIIAVKLTRHTWLDGVEVENGDFEADSEYAAERLLYSVARTENNVEGVFQTAANWAASWLNLPTAGLNAAGKVVTYTYTVEETKVTVPTTIMHDGSNGYVNIKDQFTTVQSTDGQTVALTNTIGGTRLTVKKEWQDASGKKVDGDEVRFQLVRSVEGEATDSTGSGKAYVTLGDYNDKSPNPGFKEWTLQNASRIRITIKVNNESVKPEIKYGAASWMRGFYSYNNTPNEVDTPTKKEEIDGNYYYEYELNITEDTNVFVHLKANWEVFVDAHAEKVSSSSSSSGSTDTVLKPEGGTYVEDTNGTYAFTLNSSNSWTQSFKNLPADDGAGHAYTYFVREVDANGNVVTSGNDSNGNGYTVEISATSGTPETGIGEFTIVNKYDKTVVTPSLPLKKILKDGETEINGEGITFTLKDAGNKAVATGTTDASGALTLSIPSTLFGPTTGTKTFTLTEDNTPEGYTSASPWTVTVEGTLFDSTYTWAITSVKDANNAEITLDSGAYKIVNEKEEGVTFRLNKRFLSNGSTWKPLYDGGTIYYKIYVADGTDALQYQVDENGAKEFTGTAVYSLTSGDTVWVSATDLGTGADADIIKGLAGNGIVTETRTDDGKSETYYKIPYMKEYKNLPKLPDNWSYVAVECTTASGHEVLRGKGVSDPSNQYWYCMEFNNTTYAIKNDLEDVEAKKTWKDPANGYYHPAVTFKLYRTEVDILETDRRYTGMDAEGKEITIDTLADRVLGAKNITGTPKAADVSETTRYKYMGDKTAADYDPRYADKTIPAGVGNDQSVKWEDLPKVNLANGKRYVYIVVEDTDALEAYTYDGVAVNDNLWQFSNKLPATTLYIKKFWKNADGTELGDSEESNAKKQNITFKLMKVTYSDSGRTTVKAETPELGIDVTPSGQNTLPIVETKTETIDGEEVTTTTQNWTRIIGNLPKMAYTESGVEYYGYYVEEVSLTGFDVEYRQENEAANVYHTKASDAKADMSKDSDGLEMYNKIRPEKTEFEFTKKWNSGSSYEDWPNGVENITVTLQRSYTTGEETTEKQSVTFSVSKSMTGEVDLGSVSGSQITGTLTQISNTNKTYTYKITGLEKQDGGDSSKEWTYFISEAQVAGYNMPIYYTAPMTGNEEVVHRSGTDGKPIFVSAADNKVRIENNLITVALPATGGPGTKFYHAFGLAMILFAGAMLMIKRKSGLDLIPENK